MIELDGPIRQIEVPHFEEGPWLHKRGDLYYLTYASLDRSQGENETISYATAPAIAGPWTYRGQLTGSAKNSFTIHPGIIEFKNRWYFFYHNAALTIGDQAGALGRRAVAIEHLYHNPGRHDSAHQADRKRRVRPAARDVTDQPPERLLTTGPAPAPRTSGPPCLSQSVPGHRIMAMGPSPTRYLPVEFSDPDIIRVSDDYYMAGTIMRADGWGAVLHEFAGMTDIWAPPSTDDRSGLGRVGA